MEKILLKKYSIKYDFDGGTYYISLFAEDEAAAIKKAKERLCVGVTILGIA